MIFFILLLGATIGIGICLWVVYMLAALYDDTD